jgi:hypothetical protein
MQKAPRLETKPSMEKIQTHDFRLKWCMSGLIGKINIPGNKKSITPPPFGKIAAPIFKSPKIFRRRCFHIDDQKKRT